MSTRELCVQMLEQVPDFKIGYVLAYLQGLTADSQKTSSVNEETAAALAEAEDMKNNPDQYKRYNTFRDLMDEVLADA